MSAGTAIRADPSGDVHLGEQPEDGRVRSVRGSGSWRARLAAATALGSPSKPSWSDHK